MSDLKDFVIENGVLVKYKGPGENVVIPDGVTSIGYNAFGDCSSLTSITIPNSVTSIGNSAFYRCENLTSITIPDSVTSIGGCAFKGCKKLANQDGFVIVGGVFCDYFGDQSHVTVPNSVTSIGEEAFSWCENLASITIPDSVTSIGAWAFQNCQSLTSITIPDSVTSIGHGAFSWCENLTSITIPDGVTSIGAWAFKNCQSLTSINISDSATSIGKEVFDGCDSLHIITNNFTNIPAKYKTKAVLGFLESIDDYESSEKESYFKYIKKNIEKMVDELVSDSNLLAVVCQEKLISAKAAQTYLQKAQEKGDSQSIALMLDYISTKLTTTEKQRAEKRKETEDEQVFNRILAREGKDGIDGLTFVVTGSLKTFENRTELKDFIVAKGGKLVSSISSKVDYLIMNKDSQDSEKKKKTESFGIECITEFQFNEKAGRAFVIENGVLVKYKGPGGNVVIPDGVTSIGYNAFGDCSSLTSITIPNSVTSIGEWAFYGCYKLQRITIPDSLTNISGCAFKGCKELANQDGFVIVGGVFCDYFGDQSHVTVPDSVTSIGKEAFSWCGNLASITIPDSVTSIGAWAFQNCQSLTSVTIPNSVTSIGEWAFYGCENLTIYAPVGSCAETYAKEYNIPFVAE